MEKFTTPQVASIFGVCTKTIYIWLSNDKIKGRNQGHGINNRWIFEERHLIDYIMMSESVEREKAAEILSHMLLSWDKMQIKEAEEKIKKLKG